MPCLIEGLTALLDNEEAGQERQIFSVCCRTISPLAHDDELRDACLELASGQLAREKVGQKQADLANRL